MTNARGNRPTRRGTPYFPTWGAILAYFTQPGLDYTPTEIRQLVADGSYHVGPPPLKANERAVIINENPGRRYVIITDGGANHG